MRSPSRPSTMLPAIVVDLGTATTFDVVMPGPRYVGGVIAPGVLTSAEELFRRGARLAKVELDLPPRVVGRTTEHSIQSGVLYGAAGQIDGIVGQDPARDGNPGRPSWPPADWPVCSPPSAEPSPGSSRG